MKKRKLFSYLLMGLLTVGATGAITSCKDYDDDIDNLQEQINQRALQSDLTALQTTLTNVQSTAQSAQQSATQALDLANNAATKTALDAVKATADKAASDVATALSNAANAQTSAENAAAAARNAQAAADSAINVASKKANQADLQGALDRIGKLEQTYATAKQLNDSLESLKNTIATLTSVNLNGLQKTVEAYKAGINELYSAVTSVELFGTYTGSDNNFNGSQFNKDFTLTMQHGNVTKASTFGDDEMDLISKYGKQSNPLQKFNVGDNINTDGGVFIRVNPLNADLTSAKIVLVNSQGDVLEAVKPGVAEKYDGLITRAQNINSGLWKVKFQVADGYTEEQFNKAIQDAKKNNILYAVAVNNTTDTAAVNRYVASTYDVQAAYKAYEPARSFNFQVDNTWAADIHNRWTGTQTSTEDAQKNANNVNELAWATSTDKIPTPDTKAVISGDNKNVDDDANDARYDKALFPVEVGKEFVLNVTDPDKAETKYADKIKYYYVTLDKDRAIESSPSEWNAWSSYDIDGLFTTKNIGDKLSLNIKSQAADGDIIGFRVYAVNYDGTLADPDGRAFYVQVGKGAHQAVVAGNDTITSANAEITDAASLLTAKANKVVIDLPKDADFQSATGNLSGTLQLSDGTKGNVTNDEKVYYQLLDKDGKAATDWNKATQIALGVNNGGNWKDGTDLSGTITATETSKTASGTTVTRTLNTLTVTITKVLPTSTNVKLSFRPQQNINATDFYLYMVPGAEATPNKDNVWKVPTEPGDNITAIQDIAGAYQYTQGAIDLDNTFYNLPKNIIFTFANAKTDGKKVVENTTDADNVLIEKTPYITAPAAQDWHNVTASINYGKISTNTVDDNKALKDYTVDVKQTLRAKFVCWESANTYAWGTHTEGTGNNKKTVSNKVSITYKATGNYAEVDLTNGNNSIAVTNTYDPARFSGTFGNLVASTKGYLKIIGSEFQYTGADGVKQVNPYLKPTVSTEGKLTVERVQGENTVRDDHDENLVITVLDAYGHKSTVTVPVTIKKPVAETAASAKRK